MSSATSKSIDEAGSLKELANIIDRDQDQKRQKSEKSAPVRVEGVPKRRTQGFQINDSESQNESASSISPPSPGQKPTEAAAATPEHFGGEEKKTLTKAERREIQEKQRADKALRLAAEGKKPPQPKKDAQPKDASSQVQQKPDSGARHLSESSAPTAASASTAASSNLKEKSEKKSTTLNKGPAPIPVSIQMDDAKLRSKVEKNQVIHRTESQKQVALFSHLQQYEREASLTADIKNMKNAIHPAVIQLGLKFQDFGEDSITGSNARCIGLLNAFKQVIMDYTTPADKVLSRHLDVHLKPQISYLLRFRPMSVSMGNAIRYLKKQILTLQPETTETQAKEILCESIDRFIKERIIYADDIISSFAGKKIQNGDVILTYGCSSVVQKVLVDAHKKGTSFRVIVADSRPRLEGRVLLRRLANAGIKCTYILLHALAYVMKEVSKVFLGAHTVFSNGTVMSRVGTAVVAMAANSNNVPVMVCCESYKFSERVQLDSFVFNELGDPDDLVDTSVRQTANNNGPQAQYPLSDWRDIGPLKLLSLMYDVTPADYVTMIITELGQIPVTASPVVLREYL